MRRSTLLRWLLPVAALPLAIPASGALADPTQTCGVTPSRLVRVISSSALAAALAHARPGDVITLADGRYPGRFSLSTSGTSALPVVVCGSSAAVLDGGSWKTGYGLHVAASHVRVLGLSVTRSQKGVMLDGASHDVLSGLSVYAIGDEGVHLRNNSSDVRVLNSSIHHTGLRVASYGEGVYVGSSSSKWCGLTGCMPDRSDDAVISGNRFWANGAEAIDVKEGTSAGRILGNTFDGLSSTAYSWVDVKGNDWVIANNAGQRSRRDGYSTARALDGWGARNQFTANVANVEGPGFGLRMVSENEIDCNNQVTNADRGFSNIACGP
jgi:hypothetical protein